MQNYISRNELKAIFGSIAACLRKKGLFVATVRLDDEYRDGDRNISKYNYLRYPPWVWEKLINSRLISYNRLRAPDYRELLENAGLHVEQFEIDGPTPADLEELNTISVHPFFKNYSREELGAKQLAFVATKA